ncbi:hypothetical protein LWI28_021855 [Acer negundo]|uniref:Uncharacterized protein n=1 Tax=Acer negundo TaxID=4023 RepID=A0AAD5IRX2_ACENE|nr:hypothetical protein LWI28_021855 [Acer negundo]
MTRKKKRKVVYLSLEKRKFMVLVFLLSSSHQELLSEPNSCRKTTENSLRASEPLVVGEVVETPIQII